MNNKTKNFQKTLFMIFIYGLIKSNKMKINKNRQKQCKNY